MYKVLTKRGRPVLLHHDNAYAHSYARSIGGSVVELPANPVMRKNPEWEVKEGNDSYESRIFRFAQYTISTPSFVWTREVIQNSVDNKATEIAISIMKIRGGAYDGLKCVRISDNGTGMTEKVLLEAFLTMGGTGKGDRSTDSEEFMGGFGEAKKVILLAWKCWRVITKTSGQKKATIAEALTGGRNCKYDNIDPPDEIKDHGTIVEIVCWKDTDYQVFMNDAINIVSWCDLPGVKFNFVEGEYTDSNTKICNGNFAYEPNVAESVSKVFFGHKNVSQYASFKTMMHDKVGAFKLGSAKATFQDSKDRNAAKLYYTRDKNNKSPRIFYRVKGLFLWVEWLGEAVKGDIIIDFIVKTTKILSDNRDGISDIVLREGIDKWRKELEKDPTTKLRGFSKTRTILYKGSAGALSAPLKPAASAAANAIVELRSGGASAIQKKKAIETIVETAVNKVEEIIEGAHCQSPIKMTSEIAREFIKFEAGQTDSDNPLAIQQAIERAVHIPEYLLHIDDDLYEEKFEIPHKFKAENLTIELKKIITVWAEMIRVIFMLKGSNMKFGVGFVFSDEALGMFVPAGMIPEEFRFDADGFILINPWYGDIHNRKKLIDITDHNVLKAIWGTAQHECVHMVDHCDNHDTGFASSMTTMAGIVAGIYGLIQDIARIASTANEEKRSKIRESLDVEAYLDTSVKKIRTPRERLLEKYVRELGVEIARTGNQLPDPARYGIELPESVLSEIEATRTRSEVVAGATGTIERTQINRLKRLLDESEKKRKDAELQAELAAGSVVEVEKHPVEPVRKLLGNIDIKKITRKYN